MPHSSTFLKKAARGDDHHTRDGPAEHPICPEPFQQCAPGSIPIALPDLTRNPSLWRCHPKSCLPTDRTFPSFSEHTDHTSPHGHLGTPCRRCPCAGGDGTATKEPPAAVPTRHHHSAPRRSLPTLGQNTGVIWVHPQLEKLQEIQQQQRWQTTAAPFCAMNIDG